jgi:lysophospholipase L1-like esterase
VRLRRLLSSILATAVLAATGLAAPAPAEAATTHYYVALGDSLSAGFLATTMSDSDQGYTDQLYATLKKSDAGLQLKKFGCTGESAQTMITGGTCPDRYPNTKQSQLTAALAFLKAHRGAVTYLTIDIGANDVDDCANGSIDLGCAEHGIIAVVDNLATILGELRQADPTIAHVAGMTYYNPYLAAYLTGAQGQSLAGQSEVLQGTLNVLESGLYAAYGLRVADVATAFKSDDTTLVPTATHGKLPTDVATVCTYTYSCTKKNIHPTVPGYGLIANAFAAVLK